MISTIQLRQNVKQSLENLKQKDNESYEDVIVRLIQKNEEDWRKDKKLLEEGYKEMAEESLKITKEFESIDEDFDWEWNDN